MSRKTGQAETILREQGARVTHPDADAVYRHVSREYPHISRDTVYRTLSMMEEKRIIGSVLFVGNAKRYLRCRKIIDFAARKFDHLEAPSKAIHHFKVVRTTVNVEGVCDECQNRDEA
jgi:Fur family peroxide stress response transcriptional regulator